MKNCICEITGGLGNQMFCYAAAYAASRKLSLPLFLDISALEHDSFGRKYELDFFSITAKIKRISRKNIFLKLVRKGWLLTRRIIMSQAQFYDNYSKNNCGRTYLPGNWHGQNYQFFHEYREELICEFQYKKPMSSCYQKLEKELSNYHTVAIHLRYGDYIAIGCCIEPLYYQKAIDAMDEHLQNLEKPVRFVIFSEDIVSAQKIIDQADHTHEKLYITKDVGLSDVEEFLLMKNCDDHIISNSTFSWWAAYLHNSGVVVAPIIRNWIPAAWEENYFPKEWIKIESYLMQG